MSNITASMVKDLRDKTGAGMMDCKNALNETNGDMEAAIDWLRKKGISKAAKKSGRAAAEGLIGVAVDANTGTIRMRARFDNKDTALWPGQFVGARLRLYERAGAIVVPSRALQTGPQGQYVYVVKADMSAEMRKVVVAWTEGDEAVLSEGLAKDEQVVVRGALRVSPGAKVIIAPAAGAGS